MADPVQSVIKLIPLPVRERLRETKLQAIYIKLRRRLAGHSTHRFSSPVGEFEMEIPDYSRFGEIKSAKKDGHEPILVEELGQALSAESVYYDVGAHFGYTINAAIQAGVNPDRIFGFEMDESIFRTLKRNSNSAHVINTRMGSQNTESSTSLDQFVTNHPAPDVVKIDVEGAELEILRGMQQLLTKHHPDIFVEVHPQFLSKFGANASDVLSTLENAGYQIDVSEHRNEEAHSNDWEQLPENTEFLVCAKHANG